MTGKFFNRAFLLICIIVVITMVSYWIYKYEVVDRNVGVVDYELLEKIEDDLPALAMCFMNPFFNNKLQSIEPYINSSIYLKYIQGEYYD